MTGRKLDHSVSIGKADEESLSAPIASIVSVKTGEPIGHHGGVDEAMDFVLSHERGPDEKGEPIDEATNRKLLWKIDLYLMPLICLLYAVQFMDKLSNSYASIMGLREDLHMSGSMYSWTGSAFYLGYLIFELPCAYTLQKFPVVRTVSVYILLWGIVLVLHAVPNAEGFIALRTLLGIFESAVTPAFVIITSQWYKKEEVFLRTALWFSFNGVGALLGSGAISYNLYTNIDSYSIEAWKILFITTGGITILLGILIFFHIPNKPTEAWFLNEHEKYLVVERIRDNQQGFGSKEFKKYQLIEALLDPKTWLYFVLAIANNIPNGGLTNFGSILMNESMGYTTSKTFLMQMLVGAVEVGGCTAFAYLYRFYPSRMFFATAAAVTALVSLCMLAFSSDPKVQMGGYCLNYISPLTFICILSSVASNVTGHTKKVTVNAIFLIGYCVGNLIGPQTFIESQAPNYAGAKVAMVVGGAVSLILVVVIWIELIISNRRKEAHMSEYQEYGHTEFADLTDRENPFFRYII